MRRPRPETREDLVRVRGAREHNLKDVAVDIPRGARGDALYILDEPTTGLHPADVERLVAQLDGLVDAGNTVICVEHDMRVVSASDWIIDIGRGAGAPYLQRFLRGT